MRHGASHEAVPKPCDHDDGLTYLSTHLFFISMQIKKAKKSSTIEAGARLIALVPRRPRQKSNSRTQKQAYPFLYEASHDVTKTQVTMKTRGFFYKRRGPSFSHHTPELGRGESKSMRWCRHGDQENQIVLGYDVQKDYFGLMTIFHILTTKE